MRVFAVIFSPIVGISVFLFVISILSINSKTENWIDFLLLYFVVCLVAIFVQFFIECLILCIQSFTKISYKIYLSLATIICVMIWLLAFWNYSNYDFYKRLSKSFMTFILFYIYSIINAITYNYLYFSKLDKE